MGLAQKYKELLHPLLDKSFEEYDGDLVVESPNVIKLYVSGRESCLFGILAFAVNVLLGSWFHVNKSCLSSSTTSSSVSRMR